MRKIITGFLLIMAISTLPAQKPHGYTGERPKGSLSGRIIDAKSKKAVLYASVALYSVRDSSLVTGTMSGDGGSFTIAGVPAGKYYMYVKFVGFDKKTINNIMVRPPELNKNSAPLLYHRPPPALKALKLQPRKPMWNIKLTARW